MLEKPRFFRSIQAATHASVSLVSKRGWVLVASGAALASWLGAWAVHQTWSPANAAQSTRIGDPSHQPDRFSVRPRAVEDPTTAVRFPDERLQELSPQLGKAEARLLGIYRLIARGDMRQARTDAASLVADHPNFQLAQLVYGDLLNVQTRPIEQLGDVSPDDPNAQQQLLNLRQESARRLRALIERPPEGHIPSQFLGLAGHIRHAIAVDASLSRLYLFEHVAQAGPMGTPPKLRLLADFYVSVGLQGIGKQVEGDKRTPLGVYHITGVLDPKRLPDLYGAGALTLNYPNALDMVRGKTGSGIWLHGTPREQFVRAPQASDGCVVMSNPDLQKVLSVVQGRATPVVIAQSLQWSSPQALVSAREQFEQRLQAWQQAQANGDAETLREMYSERFQAQGLNLAQWWSRIESDLNNGKRRTAKVKDPSILQWHDKDHTMVVTFASPSSDLSTGASRRQYWIREGERWRIFYEGNA